MSKTALQAFEAELNAILNAGFTKPLVEKANNPVIIQDAFDVFGGHIVEMASYAGYAEIMTDTLGWLNYRQEEDGMIANTVKTSIESLRMVLTMAICISRIHRLMSRILSCCVVRSRAVCVISLLASIAVLRCRTLRDSSWSIRVWSICAISRC